MSANPSGVLISMSVPSRYVQTCAPWSMTPSRNAAPLTRLPMSRPCMSVNATMRVSSSPDCIWWRRRSSLGWVVGGRGRSWSAVCRSPRARVNRPLCRARVRARRHCDRRERAFGPPNRPGRSTRVTTSTTPPTKRGARFDRGRSVGDTVVLAAHRTDVPAPGCAAEPPTPAGARHAQRRRSDPRARQRDGLLRRDGPTAIAQGAPSPAPRSTARSRPSPRRNLGAVAATDTPPTRHLSRPRPPQQTPPHGRDARSRCRRPLRSGTHRSAPRPRACLWGARRRRPHGGQHPHHDRPAHRPHPHVPDRGPAGAAARPATRTSRTATSRRTSRSSRAWTRTGSPSRSRPWTARSTRSATPTTASRSSRCPSR